MVIGGCYVKITFFRRPRNIDRIVSRAAGLKYLLEVIVILQVGIVRFVGYVPDILNGVAGGPAILIRNTFNGAIFRIIQYISLRINDIIVGVGQVGVQLGFMYIAGIQKFICRITGREIDRRPALFTFLVNT